MYGKTNYNMLSCFIRREVPSYLIDNDRPLREPPRREASYYSPGNRHGYPLSSNSEIKRAPDITTRRSGAENFGLERFAPGTRVSHSVFGEGVIALAKDMGGDILYEVDFKSVGKKKLMATFAKLKKI